MESVEETLVESKVIQTVVECMGAKVEAIYAPTENMSAAGMATVAMVANDNGRPVICGEGGMVEAGGLATYGIDYYELGYLAGEQAVDMLVNGAEPAEIHIGYLAAEDCELQVNQETADILGIDVSGLQ